LLIKGRNNMSLTAADAIQRLSRIESEEDLRGLISQLDVKGADGITVLYSGGSLCQTGPTTA
jgi:hypothetical protein